MRAARAVCVLRVQCATACICVLSRGVCVCVYVCCQGKERPRIPCSQTHYAAATAAAAVGTPAAVATLAAAAVATHAAAVAAAVATPPAAVAALAAAVATPAAAAATAMDNSHSIGILIAITPIAPIMLSICCAVLRYTTRISYMVIILLYL